MVMIMTQMRKMAAAECLVASPYKILAHCEQLNFKQQAYHFSPAAYIQLQAWLDPAENISLNCLF